MHQAERKYEHSGFGQRQNNGDYTLSDIQKTSE